MNERLTDLLDGYFHGSLSDGDKRELAGLLESDPAARAALAEQARWNSGIGYALARLQDQTAGQTGERPTLAKPDRPRSWKPALLALAASLLVIFGLAVAGRIRQDKNTVPEDTWGAMREDAWGMVASVTQSGSSSGDPAAAILVTANGRHETLRAGQSLPPAATISTGSDSLAQLKKKDGSTIDINRSSRIRLPRPGESLAFALLRGAVFCSVTGNRPPDSPFAVSLPNDQRVTVLGTRFELELAGSNAVVRVEEGKVRLHTPVADREAGPLEQLGADAGGLIAPIHAIPLHSIAAWKHRPHPTPAGAVLFQDDFETGLAHWQTPGLASNLTRLVEGQGVGSGHCLALRLKADSPYATLTIHPKHAIRHENFDFSFRYQVEKPLRGGPVFRTPGSPRGWAVVRASVPTRIHRGFPGKGWVDYSARVRGTDIHEIWMQEGRPIMEKIGRIDTTHGFFTHIGLGAHPHMERDMDFFMDDVAIRTLDPAPAVPAGTVLFQDDFKNGPSRWKVLLPSADRMTLAEDKGVDNSRCLLLQVKAQSPLVVLPEFELNHVNFEIRFKERTARHGRRDWIRLGPAFRMPIAPAGAVTARGTEPVKRHAIASADWAERRIVVHGMDVYETISQNGRLLTEMRSRVPAQYGYFTGIGLNTYCDEGSNDLFIDDFVVTKLDDAPAGGAHFHDDFSGGLDRWEAVQTHGGAITLGRNRGPEGRPCMVFQLRPGERTLAYPRVEAPPDHFELTCQIRVNRDPIIFGLAYRIPGHPAGYDVQQDTGPSKLHGEFVDGWAQYRAVVRNGEVLQTWHQGNVLLKEKTGRIPTQHGPFTQVGLIAHTTGPATELCIGDVTIRVLDNQP